MVYMYTETGSTSILLICTVLIILLVRHAESSSFVQSFVIDHDRCSSFHHHVLRYTRVSTLAASSSASTTTTAITTTTAAYLESLDTSRQHQRVEESDSTPTPTPHSVRRCGSCCVEPMVWDGAQISKNAFTVNNLPIKLVHELREYADRMGITDMYRRLLLAAPPVIAAVEGGERFDDDNTGTTTTTNTNNNDGRRPLVPGTEQKLELHNFHWMVQRPKSHWKSNMHWCSPADENAHDDYLRVLSRGGFDQVLHQVGTYFQLDGLSAYHLSFIGVSQCEQGFIHADVNESGRKAFNMIIPLILIEGADPELEILSDDETTTHYYKYQYNAASMVGDNALHATASCDYQSLSNLSPALLPHPNVVPHAATTANTTMMRMAATVYVGDITPANVNNLLLSLTQAYPPVGNAQHLLDRAGNHWSKTNPTKTLPLPII